MNPNLPGQIASELGQIAKDVGKQAAQIPKDIAGKAMESLGATGGKKSSQIKGITAASEGKKPETAWEQISVEHDKKIKRAIARRALEELVEGRLTKPKEPSIWERLQQEQEQKKNVLAQQKAASSMQNVSMPTGKRPRGDLYGAKAKKTATENKNVRQD